MTGVDLTEAQSAAVAHPAAPLLVVAGAGSGKTHVMAARIVHQIRHGLPAESVLGLTFSNKAAGNLRARIVRELGAGEDVTVSTYHGFGASLVVAHRELLGLADDLRLLDRAQSFQLLLDVFDEFRFVVRKTGMPLGIVGDALTLKSRANDHLVSVAQIEADCEAIAGAVDLPAVLRDAASKRAELLPLIRSYNERKQQLGLLDHDDQIAMAVRLLEQHPHIAHELRDAHPFVLLDEYQDTNFAQRRMLERIYPPGSAITAVGDDMQSIYAFRGAHVRNLFHFGHHFGTLTDPVKLEISFRNGHRILELANRIQAQVPSAQIKSLLPRSGAPEGNISCFLAADEREEAQEIARLCVAAHGTGTAWNEMAVLCRKRRLIGPVVDALMEAGVPVEVIGMGGLMMRPEVVELVAWLEVLALPDPAVATLRLLTGNRYRIGVRDLAVLAHGGGLLAALDQLHTMSDLSVEAYQRLGRFVQERHELRQAAERLALVELCQHVLTITGLWDMLDGDRPVENIARFLHAAERYHPLQGRRSLAEFLEWLQVMADSEDDLAEAVDSRAESVQIMTIHQAKGLEFDVVMIPGLAGSGSSHVFPDASRYQNAVTQANGLPLWLREDNEGMTAPPQSAAEVDNARERAKAAQRDEEVRLLYVAVTRARHTLVLSAAHRYAGVEKAQGPSEFYHLVAGQTDLVHEAFRHAAGVEDPGLDAMRRRARVVAIEQARAADAVHGGTQMGFELAAPTAAALPTPAPRALPVTALVSLGRCARQFHWTHVRPMPRRSSAAARLGTAVHSWIEQRSGRQLALFTDSTEPLDQLDQVDGDHRSSEGPSRQHLLQNSFLASPYASLDPIRVEHPVVLASAELLLRGRVDAVYERDGLLEIVDYKTGRLPFENESGAEVQLDLYALAAVQSWGADPTRLRTTAVHLRADGPPVLRSTEWDAARPAQVRIALDHAAHRIRSGAQSPTVGPWCAGCPVRDFCPEGRNATEGSMEARRAPKQSGGAQPQGEGRNATDG